MAKSDTILGRVRNREAFNERLAHNSKRSRMRWGFRVSAYLTKKGRIRFSDEIGDYTDHTKPSVQYRIKIYPKKLNLDVD